MAPDRRLTIRRPHDSVLEILGRSGRVLVRVARLVDVSANGARFTTTLTLRPGRALRARLRLLGEGVLEIEGRVVWARRRANSMQYGLAFESVRRAA